MEAIAIALFLFLFGSVLTGAEVDIIHVVRSRPQQTISSPRAELIVPHPPAPIHEHEGADHP